MKKSNIVIHIPHASLRIPKIIDKFILCKKKELRDISIFMADLYMDKLIDNYKVVKFAYSRLFCDVERFRNDNIEEMAKRGMGCIYNKDCFGNEYIKYSMDYKNYVLENFYDKHHKKLDNEVNKTLDKYDTCLIVDLHSYSDELVNTIFNVRKDDYPDICIGFDESYCNNNILTLVKKEFENYGYSVKYNYPYKGSIINNETLKNKDARVKSIMIEINKRIYLNENKIDNVKFERLKVCIKQILEKLEKELAI